MSEIAIKIENVVKKFKNTTVLKNISVEFEKGKIHGLIGRNGSGKTVLMKCICGLMPVTSGTVTVNGKIIGKDTDIPESVGMIIEAPGFLPGESAFKNLWFLASIQGKISKETVKEAIRTVGLDPDSKKHVGKYSLGMRQRLGLAQALMEDPDILVLDEPMNGLDNKGVEDIRQVLIDLKNQGKTILVASHNKDDIEILCDTVHMMDSGVIFEA